MFRWVAHVVGLGLWMSALGASSGCGSPPEPKDTQSTFKGAGCEPGLIFECESLCGGGDQAACEVAGLGYIDGQHVTKDPDRAKKLLEPACAAGRARACGGIAKLAQEGHLEMSAEQVAKRLDQGCQASDQDACQRFGQLLLTGSGVSKDPKRAHELFSESCKTQPGGCYQLGLDFKNGRAGVNPDPVKARGLFGKACEGKFAKGCYEVGVLDLGSEEDKQKTKGARQLAEACKSSVTQACETLAAVLRKGDGPVLMDNGRAESLFERACELGSVKSCETASAMLLEGDGVEVDEPRGQELQGRACELGSHVACHAVALRRIDGAADAPKEDEAAAEAVLSAQQLLEAACNAKHLPSCSRLGVLLVQGGRVAKDVPRAKELLLSTCLETPTEEDCGQFVKWTLMGEHFERDALAASKVLGAQCDKEQPESCLVLGRLLEFGDGPERDGAAAGQRYLAACRGKQVAGCVALASLAYRGVGTDADPEEAASLFESQCDEGSGEACVLYADAQFRGKGTDLDQDAAYVLVEKQCEAGQPAACARMYRAQLRGHGTRKSVGPATRKLGELCEAGDVHACYHKTYTRKIKATERRQLLQTACGGYVYAACEALRWRGVFSGQ